MPIGDDRNAARARLAGARGKEYWRGLEELADTEAFRDLLQHEFPGFAAERPDPVTRRRFLTLAGASLALAGLSGCGRPPREEIVPYVRAPEGLVPGQPLFFATAMTLGGVATGLLVEQHLGRPTKVEGNPDHPASLGATDIFAQASVLTLYDPDRSGTATYKGEACTWDAARSALRGALAEQRSRRGAGLCLLTDAVTSPTLASQLEQLLREFPEARWRQYEPVGRARGPRGARQAFGSDGDTVYHLDKADVILSLDGDFLGSGPGHLRYVRDFADRRRVWSAEPGRARMNRLYAIGPTPSSTGAMADHRLPLRAAEVAAFVLCALAVRLNVPTGPSPAEPMGRFPEDWFAALTADLRANRGRGLVVVGDRQPAFVHALAHAVNAALGNAGQTVTYIAPIMARPADEMASLRDLADDMKHGRVEVLMILGANPVFTAPADLDFARQMERVPLCIHHGPYPDETARACQWHVPEAHFLESWGDARAYDGAATIIQPLIAPLYHGVSALEFVAALRGEANPSGHELLRTFWREQWKALPGGFERRWARALRNGVIENNAFPAQAMTLRKDWWNGARDGAATAESSDSLEIVFQPDPTIHDGRFANNGWLQELPKPLTKLTWDNVALMGPATAKQLGVSQAVGPNGGDVLTDVVELHYRGRSVEAPAWIVPGHAARCVTVYLGYGRTAAGQVGTGVGFDAYAIRTSEQPWFDNGLEVRKTGRRYRLAGTQLHHLMPGDDLIRAGTLAEYLADPSSVAAARSAGVPATRRSLPIVSDDGPQSAPSVFQYPRHKWGMAIDLTVCTGCSACIVACQAENNIPIVGKEEVARGREMHWLRVDSYHTGDDPDQPTATYFQPVPCMHCEKAPCEVVCPVNATVHSDEGLNDMVYNRCVGTRTCSNECPYKVRRFNFFPYADQTTESLKALRNPEVTVRTTGVMEKCTYCVQRINVARSHAEKDNRPAQRNRAGEMVKPIFDNELLTACQAACPTGAIVFGDLNDPTAHIGKLRYDQPLNYSLLAELGTEPRTTYLAALRNPNPALLRLEGRG